MHGKTRWSMVMMGLVLASAARADALGDLRTKLAGLSANTPCKGTLTLRSTVNNDKKPTTHAQVAVQLASGADGLAVSFAPGLLAQAAREAAAQAKNPDAPTPTADALAKLSPNRLQSTLDMGPVLLRDLEGATLRTQRDELHDGKPTHLLVFDVPAGVGADDRDAIKHYEGTLSIWLGADGLPVATVEQREYKGRKFLISFTFGNTVTNTLAHIGTRLVAVSQRAENHGSGFGQSSDSVTETTLSPAG